MTLRNRKLLAFLVGTEEPLWGVIFRGNPIDFFAPLSNLFKTVALLRPHNQKFVVTILLLVSLKAYSAYLMS